MTYKEYYNEQKQWDRRVLIIDLFHNKMKLKHGRRWNIRKTANRLGLSVGAISEGLRIARALREDKLAVGDCKSRQEALERIKSGEAHE